MIADTDGPLRAGGDSGRLTAIESKQTHARDENRAEARGGSPVMSYSDVR